MSSLDIAFRSAAIAFFKYSKIEAEFCMLSSVGETLNTKIGFVKCIEECSENSISIKIKKNLKKKLNKLGRLGEKIRSTDFGNRFHDLLLLRPRGQIFVERFFESVPKGVILVGLVHLELFID